MAVGIWIIGRTTSKDYGETALIQCPNCRNLTYFRLVFSKKWIEYFWIKLIAYQRRYYLSCGICSRGSEIRGRQVEAAKRLNKATLALLDNSLVVEQYEVILNDVRIEIEQALENVHPLLPIS